MTTTNTNVLSTIAAPKFLFVFSDYQLKVLAALDMGAETSVEIMELIEPAIDKFARRRTCEALATLDRCEIVEREMIGSTRFASIRPEAEAFVASTLAAASLEG